MKQAITPCLWFDGNAEEAVNFYISTIKNARINTVTRFGNEGYGAKGSVLTIVFELNGLTFMALNGGPEFAFTPAISLILYCENQVEIDAYWEKLGEGGVYSQCGWLTDKFGLSWQIVPTILDELMGTGDAAKSDNVMKALLQMGKLDIEMLEKAHRDG